MRYIFLALLVLGLSQQANTAAADPMDDPTIKKLVQSKQIQAAISIFVTLGKQSGLSAINKAGLPPEKAEQARIFLTELWETKRGLLEQVHAEDVAARFTKEEQELLVAFFANDRLQNALDRLFVREGTMATEFKAITQGTKEQLGTYIASLVDD